MAKLTRLMHQITALKEQLFICNQAYIQVVKKYRQLQIKYSYEETMEQVKKVGEGRVKEGKIIL